MNQARTIQGSQLNHVLAALLEVIPDDADLQLSLLLLAMIWACREIGISKEVLLEQLDRNWGIPMERGSPIESIGRA